MIATPSADLTLAERAVIFSAVGTAGQRCTTLRRTFVHEKIYDRFLADLLKAYQTVPMGDPLAEGTLLGPLHTAAAVKEYEEGLAEIVKQGGKIVAGGKRAAGRAALRACAAAAIGEAA